MQPPIPSFLGATFRPFRGPADFALMADVITRSREADGVTFAVTAEDMAATLQHPTDMDPASDVLLVEAGGAIVGVSRMWRDVRADGTIAYEHSADLVPAWRVGGLRELLFDHNERHARELARREPAATSCVLVLWANDDENEWKALALRRGYRAVQHELDMVRSLDDLPDFPLPEGVEVRPVTPEDVPAVWAANREAWRGTWDYAEDRWDEAHLESYRHRPDFQPDLWQVAWDGETIVGMVQPFIRDEENRRYGRLRGYTEGVYVREGYRGRGIARALLARSLRLLKERGMTEANLGMEVENPHNPLRLYEGMGFRIVKHFVWFQKPV